VEKNSGNTRKNVIKHKKYGILLLASGNERFYNCIGNVTVNVSNIGMLR